MYLLWKGTHHTRATLLARPPILPQERWDHRRIPSHVALSVGSTSQTQVTGVLKAAFSIMEPSP